MIIQIIGLPGSGKTELSTCIKKIISAVHLNADEIRRTINVDLGFSINDRIEQARRMGEMSRIIHNQGFNVIADFVCPTNKTREVFGKSHFLIWVDRIQKCIYEDTNLLWENPQYYDYRVREGSIKELNDIIILLKKIIL